MNDEANRLTFDGVTYVTANEAVLMVMMATGYSGGGAYRRLTRARRDGTVRWLSVSTTQRWFALADVEMLVAELLDRKQTVASGA